MRNNFKVFFSLDKLHKNGQVDWDEYYQHYLRDRLGLAEPEISRMRESPATVSRDLQESLANVKAAWSEVGDHFSDVSLRISTDFIILKQTIILSVIDLERNNMTFICILFRNILFY